MIHKEAWYIEAGEDLKEFESLRRNKLDAMEAYVRELSRAGKLKDLPKNQLVGFAHFGILRGMDLRGADLWGADLREANLQGADLQEANLREANLQGANLRETNLWGVDLKEANLREANLQETNLWGANLREADLRGASYGPSQLENTVGTPIT